MFSFVMHLLATRCICQHGTVVFETALMYASVRSSAVCCMMPRFSSVTVYKDGKCMVVSATTTSCGVIAFSLTDIQEHLKDFKTK